MRRLQERLQERSLLEFGDAPYQQAMGAMHRDAPGEAVMDGQSVHVRRGPVAPLGVHVSTQVEVQRVPPQLLLTHVLQLHVGKVHCREVPQDLHDKSTRIHLNPPVLLRAREQQTRSLPQSV